MSSGFQFRVQIVNDPTRFNCKVLHSFDMGHPQKEDGNQYHQAEDAHQADTINQKPVKWDVQRGAKTGMGSFALAGQAKAERVQGP